MSADRNSSAVRNLRAKFEQKDTPEASPSQGRGRSPLGQRLGDQDTGRPLSKVRSSFVSVDPSGQMAGVEDGIGSGMSELKRESSAGLRRGSFSISEESDGNALAELKKTVSGEHERREADNKISETIPESALEATPAATPNMKATPGSVDQIGSKLGEMSLADGRQDGEPERPDKAATGSKDDASTMQPAKPTSEDAVSGGQALPPVTEDLRQQNSAPKTPKTNGDTSQKSSPSKHRPTGGSALASAKSKADTKKPTPNGKPAAISTKAPSKASSSSLKSPSDTKSQPRTPSSANAPSASSPKASSKATSSREPAKKASRSSLTAPTAASVARAANSDRQSSTSTKSSPPKTKPRETTRPADISSRLTAPTAASRAKHEAEPTSNPSKPTMNGKASISSLKSSTTSRPKPPTSSARPTPRTSLQRPESRTAQAASRPKQHTSSAGAGASFLERMMRPTAASEQKKHEKVEAKSPPRRQGSVMKKPNLRGGPGKINGVMKSAADAQKGREAYTASQAGSRPGTSGTQKCGIQGETTRSDVAGGLVNGPDAGSSLTPGPDKVEAKADEMPGNETPVPQTNGHGGPVNAVMEGTPAFEEDGIR